MSEVKSERKQPERATTAPVRNSRSFLLDLRMKQVDAGSFEPGEGE